MLLSHNVSFVEGLIYTRVHSYLFNTKVSTVRIYSFFVTLKAPIMIAADDIHKYFFIAFQRKQDLTFHVNFCLAEDSHETSSLIFFER